MGAGPGSRKAAAAATPANSGITSFTRLSPVRRATAKAMLISSTTATSKKSGKAQISPAIPMAKWARFSPKVLSMRIAIWSTAPVSCRILPNIAPSATTIARKPSVPPMPFCMVSAMLSSGIPDNSPAPTETSIKARKACMRAFITRKSSSRTEPAAVKISVAVFMA